MQHVRADRRGVRIREDDELPRADGLLPSAAVVIGSARFAGAELIGPADGQAREQAVELRLAELATAGADTACLHLCKVADTGHVHLLADEVFPRVN